MRLPGVSLTFVAGVLLTLAAGAAEARPASDPSMVTNCLDILEPDLSGGAAAGDEVLPPAARPVPTPLATTGLADERTYRDVFRILSADNKCSEFYGGPAKAATAFNQFARQLKRARLDDPRIALRMSGDYTNYQDFASGAAYRLFERATINTNGPVTGQAARMFVGSYGGHTPQARALVLLHELGHLVQGPGRKWLLPNDGGDVEKSARNTRLVEAHCAEQLRAIRD